MYNHNISIKVNSNLGTNLLSPKDDFIMSIKRLKTYAPGQQTDINLVRIYLQVPSVRYPTHRISSGSREMPYKQSDLQLSLTIQDGPDNSNPAKSRSNSGNRI